MSKLTLDALKERAGAVASEDLLKTISGGTENACHPTPQTTEVEIDNTAVKKPRIRDIN